MPDDKTGAPLNSWDLLHFYSGCPPRFRHGPQVDWRKGLAELQKPHTAVGKCEVGAAIDFTGTGFVADLLDDFNIIADGPLVEIHVKMRGACPFLTESDRLRG